MGEQEGSSAGFTLAPTDELLSVRNTFLIFWNFVNILSLDCLNKRVKLEYFEEIGNWSSEMHNK